MLDPLVEIRRATPDDAMGIANVQRVVWPYSHSEVAHVADVLREPYHTTYVAVRHDFIVGYIDCFLTMTHDNIRRWEVDELAVHVNHQRQRIGQSLVQVGTEAGRELDAVFARALIQIENTASQQTFIRCGYHTTAETYSLYVCNEPLQRNNAPRSDLHLIPVNTLSYRGVWLEGEIKPESFQLARRMCAQNTWNKAGVLLPVGAHKKRQAAETAGFEYVHDYHWWNLDLA